MYTCCKLRTVHRSKAQWYKWCPHNFMKGSAMWTPATHPSPTTYCQHQSWWLFQNQQLTSQPLPSTVNTRAGDYFRTSNYLHNPYHLPWTPELMTISKPATIFTTPTVYREHQSWWLFQNQQLSSQPLPSTVNTRAGDYFRTSNYLHNPYHLLWTPELVTISEPATIFTTPTV